MALDVSHPHGSHLTQRGNEALLVHEDLPQVLSCYRPMLPDGALFTEDKVPIPVVIVADLRAMADWLPPQAQRIGGISCVALALDGTSHFTRHSFEQIGERNPTIDEPQPSCLAVE